MKAIAAKKHASQTCPVICAIEEMLPSSGAHGYVKFEIVATRRSVDDMLPRERAYNRGRDVTIPGGYLIGET
jgi:hypothetical protein